MRKKNIVHLLIGFIGAMAGGLGICLFNKYVLMSLPLPGRMIAMIVVYWLLALIPILLMVSDKEKLSEIGFEKENILSQIAVGIGIALVLSALLTVLPHLIGFGEWVGGDSRYTHLWQFIFQFLYCIVSVGATEEFVFRGYLYKKARDAFDSERWAVIISSVMFGLVHIFTGNVIQVFMTMILGIIWCLCRLKIRHCSLLSLILAHGIYDALIVVVASVLRG